MIGCLVGVAMGLMVSSWIMGVIHIVGRNCGSMESYRASDAALDELDPMTILAVFGVMTAGVMLVLVYKAVRRVSVPAAEWLASRWSYRAI